MAIVFPCRCGKKLQAQDEHAGRRVRCPVCGVESTIPRPDAVLPASAATDENDPNKTVNLAGSRTLPIGEAPPADDPAPPRRQAGEANDPVDDSWGEPRIVIPGATSKKAVASLMLGVASFVLTFVVGVPAIILGWLGMRDVNRSGGRLEGWGIALTGMILGIAGSLFSLAVAGIIALAVPAYYRATGLVRTAAVRMQDQNNLKQIALAMHSYCDDKEGLPVRGAITGKDGKPLLSWRVALLPYLGEEALYQQFHLNEPWDSPHNKSLLAQMPPVYASPQDFNGPLTGLTNYRLFVGPGTPLEPRNGKPPRLIGIEDGTSNTLMIVEVADPVEWTRPDELPYDPKAPLPKLGGLSPDGFNVAFWDGSVRFISTSTPEATIRAMITSDGGEAVPLP